ncbi:MAG: OmpA family protein [Spirochaetota bacterium]
MNTPIRVVVFALLLAFQLLPRSFAEETVSAMTLRLPERIRISERSNLSTREDGRYAGLLNRQVTGYLTRSKGEEYDGRFFLYEQVRLDMQQVARPIDQSIASSLSMTSTTMFEDAHDYPSIQQLLRLPRANLRPGSRWQAPAWISIDPRRNSNPLRLPVLIDYHFVGVEDWNGSPAFRVEARFATRYPLPPSDDPEAPVVDYVGEIVSVRGSHRLTIMLPQSGDSVAFLRDRLEEQYRFSDGAELVHEGHTLLFLSGLLVEEQVRIAREVQESIASDAIEGVSVDRTSTGVRLTIESLRFLPDQAVLLPDERSRLDSVASALERVEENRFLVVGHTADVGSTESQQRLSVERARLIATELAARGVSPDRIDVEGRGGSEPAASNATEAGRARNRRVEIYIVED